MKTKKLLAAVLALTMVFGNGINVANHAFIESSVCADAVSGIVVIEGDTLKLRGEISAEDVRAFAKDDRFKHIVAEEGAVLPKYCDRLFENCKAESIDLSKADTSKVTDMSQMFYYCENLTSLDISSFDTSNVTNMSNMFYSCSSLTSLDMSNFNTSNVTDMNSMFRNCSSLTALDLSNFDTSKVTDMSWMFADCKNLTSLDLSNFDTSNVTSMAMMFYCCVSLPSLDVSSFNTSKTTNMNSMFYYCFGLTTLDLSNFDTSNVTAMNSMFFFCLRLTALDLTKFDTSKVSDMKKMFAYDIQLKTIKVSDKWKLDAIIVSEDMFLECNVLRGSRGTACTDCSANGEENRSSIDKTYAHIDTLGTPGYLSGASYDLMTDVKLTANAPVAGKSPETNLTINSEGISKVSSVKWYDGSKELTDKDKFTTGKTYTAKFTLVPDEAYMFAADTKVTVNGIEAKPTSDEFCREVEYTVNFKAKEPASSADSKSSSNSGTSSAPKKDSSSKSESKSGTSSTPKKDSSSKPESKSGTSSAPKKDSSSKSESKSGTSSAPKKDSSSKSESKSGTSSTPKKDSSSKPDNNKLMNGDVNLDAKINVTDIAMVASHIKGIKALEGDGLANADVNDDEKVNVTDIAMIAAHIKGIKPLI